MKEKFEEALKENKYDELTHFAYADWLEEEGFDEEAVFHRTFNAEKYKKAEKWMDEFADYLNEKDNYYDEDYKENFTLEKLIEMGIHHINTGSDYCLGFTTPARCFTDIETFWENIKILTGRELPEDEDKSFFRCAC